MNSRMIACLRRCRYPLMLLLGALPLMLYGAYRFFPQDAARCLALVPVCALLASLCMALPGRRRLPGAIVSCALLAAVCAYALPLSSRPLLLAVPVLLCLLLLASLSLAARTVTDMSPAFYIAGVVSHLFVQALIRFARGDLRAACEATQPLLAAVFLAYLLLMLLAFNSISLDNATMARFRLPASMRHTNTLLTLAFLAAAALLAALPAVLQLIKAGIQAIRRLMRLLGDLVTWLLGEAPGGFGGGSPQPMSLFGAEAVSEEPSMFSLLIEKLVTALAVAAFAFGLFIILRFLLRRALILARRLLARLRAYAAVVSDDYSDEITDTRSEDGRRDEYLRRRRGHAHPARRPARPAHASAGAMPACWPGANGRQAPQRGRTCLRKPPRSMSAPATAISPSARRTPTGSTLPSFIFDPVIVQSVTQKCARLNALVARLNPWYNAGYTNVTFSPSALSS